MVQHGNFDPKVSCPACEEPVPIRTSIVDLGGCVALLCPRCGELSFPKAASKPPLPRR